MSIRPIRVLGDRSGRFARELGRRYARGHGYVPAVDATLVPLRRAAGRQLVVQRYTLNVAPRLRLALASAPYVPPVSSGRQPAADGHSGGSFPRLELVVRSALSGHVRRVLELRVAHLAGLAAERALERATRIEAGRPSTMPGRAALQRRQPAETSALPPLSLAFATRPAERTVRATAAAELVAGEQPAEWRSEPPFQLAGAVSTTPPVVDVEQITDSVLDAIDRRVVAHRERLETR